MAGRLKRRTAAQHTCPPLQTEEGSDARSPFLPLRSRLEPEDAREGGGTARRRGLLRSRGFRRAAREGGRARERDRGAQGERVPGEDQSPPRQRRVHQVVREG